MKMKQNNAIWTFETQFLLEISNYYNRIEFEQFGGEEGKLLKAENYSLHVLENRDSTAPRIVDKSDYHPPSFNRFFHELFTGIYSAETQESTDLYGHCSKLIGWGKQNGREFWTMANTWGRDWGENG